MKRTRVAFIMFVVLAFLVILGASEASAQLLDDTWFKLKINFKAHAVDSVTNAVTKYNFKVTFYALFDWNVDHYEVEYWAKQTNGTWQMVDSGDTVLPAPADEKEMILAQFGPWFEDGSGLGAGAWLDPYCKVKKKTTIKGTGACWGSDASGNDLYGYANVKGKSINPSKLPFTP